MDRPVRVDADAMSPVEAKRLTSEELYYAAAHAPRPGQPHRLRGTAETGETDELELLFFPDSSRAGIAWRENVWWLDASSVEEALQRWLAGEGRMNTRRRFSRGEAWRPEPECEPPTV